MLVFFLVLASSGHSLCFFCIQSTSLIVSLNQIPLVDAPPLQVQTTHPRILFHITYLLSANAKRDVTGRNPKRKLFLSEGLRMWDVESKHDVPREYSIIK
jgi:hypothetical protein